MNRPLSPEKAAAEACEAFDSVEWLRKMIRHSHLTDCKPEFERIAAEIERLRAANIEAETEAAP